MRVCCAGRQIHGWVICPNKFQGQSRILQSAAAKLQRKRKAGKEKRRRKQQAGDREEVSRALPRAVHKGWGLRSVARPGPSSDPGGTLPKQHKTPQSVVNSQGSEG